MGKPFDLNESEENLIKSYIERSRKSMYERMKSKDEERKLEESRVEKKLTKPKPTIDGQPTFGEESVVVIHVPPADNALLSPI